VRKLPSFESEKDFLPRALLSNGYNFEEIFGFPQSDAIFLEFIG
jgi:hypothetical protein